MASFDRKKVEDRPLAWANGAPISLADPLCVDLDGTLVKTDTLLENTLAAIKNNPAIVFLLPLWLTRGRAYLKQRLARAAALEPRWLPYNEEVLAFLTKEHARGRALVLATGADARVAQAVAEHVGLFEEVIASCGERNLTSSTKARALVERFGEKQFDYLGNSAADVAVWRRAKEILAVGVPDNKIRRWIGRAPSRTFACPSPIEPLRPLLRSLRPHQWVKNLLVFVPLIAGHQLTDFARLRLAVAAFVIFSLGASGVYATNDLLDLSADRRHPLKRNRPYAAGDLPLMWGFIVAPLLLLTSTSMAFIVNSSFGVVFLSYVVLTTWYSLQIKALAVLDVIVLASLYTIRIYAGGTVTSIRLSEWLLAFSMFLFLSLAFLKRYAELTQTKPKNNRVDGRGYQVDDAKVVLSFGTSTASMAVLIFAVYISNETTQVLYPRSGLLWFVCPAILYWLTRVWFLAQRHQMPHDPIAFAVKDRTTYAVALFCFATLYLASIG